MKKNVRTEKVAGISSEAVRAKTGKGWAEWFAILDGAGAPKLSHTEIAAYLHQKRKVPGWWCQMVAVGYEQARGLREKHETAMGYQASVSKTISAPLGKLFEAWKDDKIRSRWLSRAPMTIHKTTTNKSIRVAWNGTISNMDVRFYVKGKGKSQVVVDQTKLKNSSEVTRMKNYWGERLGVLKTLLEG